MQTGHVVPATKGKLTKVWNRTTGEGQFGPYSVQPGMLEDGPNKIKVKFWDREDVKNLEGCTLYIEAKVNDKGQADGVIRDQSKSKDPKYDGHPELKINKTAIVTAEGKSSQQQQPPAQQQRDNNYNPDLEAGAPQQQAPIDKAGPVTLNDIDGEIRKYAMRIANTRLLAERAADYVVKAYIENHIGGPIRQFTDDAVREIATSLYIQMTRDNVQFKMPGKKLTPIAPPEPPPPPKQTPPPQNSQPAEPPPDV